MTGWNRRQFLLSCGSAALGAALPGRSLAGIFDSGGFHKRTHHWRPIAPYPISLRDASSAVWTGSQLITYGGIAGAGAPVGGGAIYTPATNTWATLPTAGAPSARWNHSAVWTGSKMVIWGGGGPSSILNDGAVYDLASNTWSPLASPGLAGRGVHRAVWTGSKMFLWGGSNFPTFYGDGGLYDPTTNTWSPISTVGAPTARDGYSMAWTGSKVIVWGGADTGSTSPTNGALYDPSTNTWSPMSSVGAPVGRNCLSSPTNTTWTGTHMAVWGGYIGASSAVFCADGGLYNPATDTWSMMSASPFSTGRTAHSLTWNGSEIVLFGGRDSGGASFSDGAFYNPTTNKWRVLPTTRGLSARRSHAAVWTGTGSQVIVVGGWNGTTDFSDGAILS